MGSATDVGTNETDDHKWNDSRESRQTATVDTIQLVAGKRCFSMLPVKWH